MVVFPCKCFIRFLDVSPNKNSQRNGFSPKLPTFFFHVKRIEWKVMVGPASYEHCVTFDSQKCCTSPLATAPLCALHCFTAMGVLSVVCWSPQTSCCCHVGRPMLDSFRPTEARLKMDVSITQLDVNYYLLIMCRNCQAR